MLKAKVRESLLKSHQRFFIVYSCPQKDKDVRSGRDLASKRVVLYIYSIKDQSMRTRLMPAKRAANPIPF